MRTTVDISDAKLTELREKAREEKRSFRTVLDEVIALGLAVSSKSADIARAPVKIETHPLETKQGFEGISMNQLYDQIEAESTLSPH